MNSATVFYENVILALACNPNTSGSSSNGSYAIYA